MGPEEARAVCYDGRGGRVSEWRGASETIAAMLAFWVPLFGGRAVQLGGDHG
jgi:hypothetical protein